MSACSTLQTVSRGAPGRAARAAGLAATGAVALAPSALPPRCFNRHAPGCTRLPTCLLAAQHCQPLPAVAMHSIAAAAAALAPRMWSPPRVAALPETQLPRAIAQLLPCLCLQTWSGS